MVFVDKQVSGPTRRGGYDEIEMTDKILDRRGAARRRNRSLSGCRVVNGGELEQPRPVHE